MTPILAMPYGTFVSARRVGNIWTGRVDTARHGRCELQSAIVLDVKAGGDLHDVDPEPGRTRE